MFVPRMFLLAASLLVLTTCISADRTYTITAPKNVRPSTPYQVVVSIHNTPEPVLVHANLSCERDGQVATGDIEVANGETKILTLEIGPWKQARCQLAVEGEGGITFERSTALNFNSKLFSMFIQTDKAIYQPGQLVQFRVLVVDPNLKPYKSRRLNVYATDSATNRIKQWTNSTLKNGIFSGEIQLSDQPVLGDWNIEAELKGEKVSKSVTVEEYVLPKFEVTVRPPTFATFNDSEIVISVDAKYTFGKPVKGKLLLNTTESYCRRPYSTYCGSTPVVIRSDIDGTATARVPISQLNFPSYYVHSQATVEFFATVTEELTGRQMNATGTVTIYPRKEKIEISQSSSTFKPGLHHSYTIKLQLQDGTPVTNADAPLLVKHRTSYSKPEAAQNYTIPLSGIVTVDVFPNEDSEYLQLNVEYKDLTDSASATRATSISTKYLQLAVDKKNPKVGDIVNIGANATFYVNQLGYEVVARGKILASGSVKFDKDAKYQSFPLNLTQGMAPRTRVVVYYVSSCGEVVVDTLDFSVDGLFQTPVELSTSENRTKPGAPLDVIVETSPNALVGLLAIDQSVLLLKGGNDITKNQVVQDLDGYESGWRPSSYDYKRKKRYIWRAPGETPNQLFDNAGLVFFSNGLFQKTQSYGYGEGMLFPAAGSAFGGQVFMAKPAFASPQSAAFDVMTKEVEEVKPVVRKEFPETWIWDDAVAGKDGKAVLKTTVPDTITSWVISAFAMDEENGLGMADGPSKVEVFRPFFVSLNLPYSIVRGEAVAIQAIVFNYLKDDVEAEVTLENPDNQFELTGYQNRVDAVENATSEKKTVKVKAGDGASVSFLITPLVVGHVDLKVTAIAPTAGDALIRKLLVKAEGSPQFFNKPLLIDLRNASEFKQTVEVMIPDFAVKDSEYTEVSAIGDIMGPTVNNLHNLLRMPYGCGEQNMVNFVPNVVIAQYLTNIGMFPEEQKSKALKFMESGYQRELTYKRNDGSFSAFGQSDNNGSTWLTAFVVRSFGQARKFIEIDDNVMRSASRFLANLQFENGSFPEYGVVHHKRLQGGSSHGNSLTAFVFLALFEFSDPVEFGNATKAAREFLEREVAVTEDPYELAIMTEALHVAKSKAKDAPLERLMKMAVKKGDRVYWTKPEPEKPVNATWWYVPPPSVDIEIASYALMSLVSQGRIAEAIPVMRYLISQRNENGGFSSTQDTVTGITALGDIATHITSPAGSKMDIDFNYNKRNKRLTLENSNALVLQKEQLPKEVREVEVVAKGSGVGIVQITWSYNLDNKTSSPSFEITPTVKRVGNNSFELTVCAVYKGEDDNSNMAVIEIHLPSGYEVEAESLPTREHYETLKRVDTTEGGTKLELYFDRMTETPTCPRVTAVRAFEVANIKPALVKVYDYYENDKTAETFYEAPKRTLCDICQGDDCSKDCRK